MSGRRLTKGGLIDRSRQLAFTWAGRRYHGFAGDTLASALLANGISTIGRSFKYHRPRGFMAAGLEEPNGIVQLETGAHAVPNVKATQIELYDGLVAAPVNAWPSADFDLMAVTSVAKRFIPAAFYYKTFMWPHWHWFEPSIRRAAGLGVAPAVRDPDSYEHCFAHVETLVVGSGAAGLAAARAASDRGEQVLLVETDAELGGGLLATTATIEGRQALEWRSAMIEALRSRDNVTLMPRTMAFGFYDHELVGLFERVNDHLPPSEREGTRQRLWKVRAGRVILATGAFERPMAFAGNDLPGVMLASAAQTYALRYGVAVGTRLVVATNNDTAYETAFALADAGITIAAIIDTRADVGAVGQGAAARSIRVIRGSAPVRAKGSRRVRAVTIGPVTGGAASETIPCDALLTAGGWNPAVHLHSQSGGRLGFDAVLQAFLPSDAAQNSINVGAAAGLLDMDAAIAQARALATGAEPTRRLSAEMGPLREFADGDPQAAKAWLDFQNDVTVADVQLAARENFRSVEHVKRYTTLGMASDQGKTSNVSAIKVMAGLLHKAPAEIGTTKFRPPFDPVTIGAFAGRATGQDLMPAALTAAHDAHVAGAGVMEQYGGWIRAAYYARSGEDEHAAIAREVLAVRRSVGLFEASPLGKIEVKGPDAAEFLDRMYVNGVKNLKVGRCRYGLMLNENGVVYDDGVFARIAEDHFLVGTTSGHAGAVADNFQEWLQCEWPHLDVSSENVTTSWAVMNLAGPKARDVLDRVGTDIDLSNAAFPHMTYRTGSVAGVPARIQRVSFTGELSYEVAVPWRYGAALWDAMIAAGRIDDIVPFGIESLMAMRIEKGFLHVGSDTDGTTLPQDVGFGGIIAKKEGDFVGRRSTMRPDGMRDDRRQLIGLEVTDGMGALNAGAHVLSASQQADPGSRRRASATGEAATTTGSDGWVTSSVSSPTLGRPLAMALVRQGHSRTGKDVQVWDMGVLRRARIVDPRFYDPSGERLDG